VRNQQVTETNRRISFVYNPETPSEILGQPIEFLASIKVLGVNFADIFKTEKFAVNGEPVTLHLSLLLNGLTVVSDYKLDSPAGGLTGGQCNADVSNIFTNIPGAYRAALSKHDGTLNR